MDLHENNLYGRKVFFVYPTFDFQNIVIDRLFNMEYEVYILKELSQAKNVLLHYPDSICFINIDSELTPQQWLNFIHSFELDPILSTIFLGIISHINRERDREMFLFNADIPAGFISTASNFDDLTSKFIKILDLNGAKGRRKYIRADCSHDSHSFIKLNVNSNIYDVKIKYISSVGFSADIPLEYDIPLKINMLIRSCIIKLNDKSLTEPATIISINPFKDKVHVVFVFLKAMTYNNKSIIRSYIHERLNAKISDLLKGCIPDSYDYSVAPEIPGMEKENFMLSPNEDFIEDLPVLDEKDMQYTDLF